MKRLHDLGVARRIYLLSSAVLLLFFLLMGGLLLQFRQTLYEERRQEIRHLAEAGWHVLEFYARRAESGSLPDDEARSLALQSVGSLRFDDGNYLWVGTLSGVMAMHPFEPRLNGQNLLDLRDASGKTFFSEMVEAAGRAGGGYVDYYWPRPGETEAVAKVGFVKAFSAWDLVIGTGYYLDDIDRYVLNLTFLSSGALGAVLLLALLLVTYLARSISSPLRRAVGMIEALEQGDMGYRLRLRQKDEVGRMGRALDRFADNLQDEIFTAFDHLARGDFTFQASGLIREPLARTNGRLNELVAQVEESLYEAVMERNKTETMIAAIGEGVAIFDPQRKIVYQNQAHVEIFGDHRGCSCASLDPGAEHQCGGCVLARAMAEGRVLRTDRVLQREEGELHLEVTVSPVVGSAGAVDFLIEVARDVTRRKQIEAALIESEARYSSIFQNNHAVMLLIDPQTTTIIDANPSACDFYGYDREQLLGMKIARINALSDAEIALQMAEAQLQRKKSFHFRHRLATGEVREVEVFSGTIKVQKRELLYSIVHDITERKVAEARVEYLAFHDPLTGLPNRALLNDRLSLSLADARRRQEEGALFFIDLDRFKMINDSLGHHAGDLLLQEVARRLKAVVRATDTVCRSGGDEFILLLNKVGSATNAAHVAEKVLAAFAPPFLLEDREVFVSPSIGISLFPADGADFATLSRNADAAMYQAKKEGRNNYQFFKPELTDAVQKRLDLENRLRKALAAGELHLHYQPQFCAATGEMLGIEALARWHHPEVGWISPGEFIPVAEESGLIEPLGAWVLREACRQSKEWLESGFPPVRMAVNVSGRQFRQPDFIESVDRILAETAFDPRWLEVEVTENVVMENVSRMVTTLTDLKSRGISLAIDDFGTGYSSLSYLRQFPLDRLKIDRSFVARIPGNADDAAIASAIVSLAKTLNLQVVAEGVETAAQARFLSDLGCDAMQGYYYGRPVPAEEMARLLNEMRAAAAG